MDLIDSDGPIDLLGRAEQRELLIILDPPYQVGDVDFCIPGAITPPRTGRKETLPFQASLRVLIGVCVWVGTGVGGGERGRR